MSTASTRPRSSKIRPKAKPASQRPSAKRQSSRSIGKASSVAPSTSKQARVIALLRTASGGSIEQLTKLTGCQPHSVRGTISSVLPTRLGLIVSSEILPSGVRAYRIIESRR
jgi:hypothetical protein